jgi:hypothetical protein
MKPPSQKPAPGTDSPAAKGPPRRPYRTHTPRPDELSRETFEFITAIDEYKRRHMRSFLGDDEVIEILLSLGYGLAKEAEERQDASDDEVHAFVDARERYRHEEGRLFPTWSEVFQLLLDLGYVREDSAA